MVNPLHNKKIMRFPLSGAGNDTTWQSIRYVELPTIHGLLHTGFHKGELSVWAACDEESFPEVVKFRIFVTGQKIALESEDGEYVGSTRDGNKTWFHVFVDGNPNSLTSIPAPPR